jgi:hypothetical protein
VIDTTHASTAQEVLAAPSRPATVASTAPAATRGASGDSVALYYALADSADSLDAMFQRARASLNSEARAIDGASDRRARDYATRYAAFEARRDSAEMLRTRRDRLRVRRDALRTRLGNRIPASAAPLHP